MGHQLHGYPATPAAEGGLLKARPPTRRDTRFVPRILRQADTPRTFGDLGSCLWGSKIQ
jgi:hypothetical protein